jgi:REP element-mobilizing transposase RayT
MANTYTALYYHIVFSTKNRVSFIQPEIEARVWAYIGGVARAHKLTALQVGGIEDHIHALVMAPATLSPSQIAQYLKGDSSKWIHEEFPELRGFAWPRRLRSVHGEQIESARCDPLHREPARASPPADVSGGVPGLSEKTRD